MSLGERKSSHLDLIGEPTFGDFFLGGEIRVARHWAISIIMLENIQIVKYCGDTPRSSMLWRNIEIEEFRWKRHDPGRLPRDDFEESCENNLKQLRKNVRWKLWLASSQVGKEKHAMRRPDQKKLKPKHAT